MGKRFTLRLYGLVLASSVFFIASSGGPEFDSANAPGDGLFCGSCHSGGDDDAQITLSGQPASYTPGATYPLVLTITDPTAIAGGFQIVATNGSTNTQIGTFSVPAGTRLTGAQRLTQSTPKSFSGGNVSWSFNWTAPGSGPPQNVQFYFAGNGSNLDGSTGGDDGVWSASALIPLPVQLVDFNATYIAGHRVLLSWKTASEREADAFMIERTTDHRTFEVIGQVPAQGTSTELTSYQFVDEKLGSASTYYYRLTQRDFDGSLHRYPLVSVSTKKAPVRVYFTDGMPALHFGNQLKFRLTTELNLASARLVSTDGRLLGEAQIAGGQGEVNLMHSGASTGLHFLQLFDSAGHLVHVEKVL